MTRPGEPFDDATLATLEFPAIIDQIVRVATCEPGRAAIRALRPQRDAAAIEHDLTLIDDAVAFFQGGGDFGFGGAVDFGASIDRAELGATLSGIELQEIARSERALAAATNAIGRLKPAAPGPVRSSHDSTRSSHDPTRSSHDPTRSSHDLTRSSHDLTRSSHDPAVPGAVGFSRPSRPLEQLAEQRRSTDTLIRRLESALDEDGSVLDGASAELARLRRQKRSLADEIRRRVDDIVRNPSTAKMLSEQIVTVRGGRYVVPVRVEHAAQFAGVVHDQSASGATVYVEPMSCVEANNRLRGVEAAEEREIQRILADLSALVGGQAEELRANAALLARLDSIGARARWADAKRALTPQLIGTRAVRIVRGRHPLLRRSAVPLDIDIGSDYDAVVISGPNMGGKTVVLKTVGLFCLLTYAGIPVPAAAGTQIGAFDHIACVIGDEQSIANDLSSFSAHLQALHAAQRHAGPRTLVLVDEIGNGTEPGAGAALAQAFIEALLTLGARVIVTTHFTQLKIFGASRERVANASMLFDAKTHQPTYILAMGVPGQSLAFALARTLGLDPTMIGRAEGLLGADAQNLERAFENLAAEREHLQSQAADVERELARLRAVEAELRGRVAASEQDRARFEKDAAQALERATRAVREELIAKAERGERDAQRQRIRAVGDADAAFEKTMAQIRQSLGLSGASIAEPAPNAYGVGDRVYVRTFGQPGVVSEVYDHDVLVTMGAVKAVVSRTDLTRDPVAFGGERPVGLKVDRYKDKDRYKDERGEGGLMRSLDAATSIDVRGMRVDEAMPVVDKALDDAGLAGLTVLRIIHGKGTGQLGRGIREFLRGHAQVKSADFAPDREGGSGVTVVTLR